MAALNNLTTEIKEAMKAKNVLALEALRAIKSAVLLIKSEAGASEELTEDLEIKLLQKLVKQRRDSATIFREQNRVDLAESEEAQAEIDKMVHDLDGPYMNTNGKFTDKEHTAAMDRVNSLLAVINKAKR